MYPCQWTSKSYDFETPIAFPKDVATLATRVTSEIDWSAVFTDYPRSEADEEIAWNTWDDYGALSYEPRSIGEVVGADLSFPLSFRARCGYLHCAVSCSLRDSTDVHELIVRYHQLLPAV